MGSRIPFSTLVSFPLETSIKIPHLTPYRVKSEISQLKLVPVGPVPTSFFYHPYIVEHQTGARFCFAFV